MKQNKMHAATFKELNAPSSSQGNASEKPASTIKNSVMKPQPFSHRTLPPPALKGSLKKLPSAAAAAPAHPGSHELLRSEAHQQNAGKKPRVSLSLDLVGFLDESEGPCSGSTNTSSNTSNPQQHQRLSPVTELHLGLLTSSGSSGQQQHLNAQQPTLRIVRMPKPTAADRLQTM